MEAVDKEDAILELAIEYVLTNGYPPSLSKDRKRAVQKRAATLVVENGEVFVQKRNEESRQRPQQTNKENFECLSRRSHIGTFRREERILHSCCRLQSRMIPCRVG